jgi:hypothetical protein
MAKSPRKMPATISRSRAGALPFCISATAWVDLLGYGSMIADAELNPIDPRAKAAVTGLRTFHRIVSDHSGRYYKTLVINDGAVAYRDLSLRDNGVTHDDGTRKMSVNQDNIPVAYSILAIVNSWLLTHLSSVGRMTFWNTIPSTYLVILSVILSAGLLFKAYRIDELKAIVSVAIGSLAIGILDLLIRSRYPYASKDLVYVLPVMLAISTISFAILNYGAKKSSVNRQVGWKCSIAMIGLFILSVLLYVFWIESAFVVAVLTGFSTLVIVVTQLGIKLSAHIADP